MIDRALVEAVFARAMPYERYLASDPARAGGWQAVHDRVRLTEAQRGEIASFTREMKVLVVSGIWCGDCVQQGPLLARIAEANPRIDLRWVDRDVEADFSARLIGAGVRRLSGGSRARSATAARWPGCPASWYR